jgi:signal transduction histidine kinase
VTPLKNKKSVLAGKLIVIWDISRRKLTHQKLELLYGEEKQLRSSLQEEMDKRTKYTRALIHELRTPLTAILASGELLEAKFTTRFYPPWYKISAGPHVTWNSVLMSLSSWRAGRSAFCVIDPAPLDMVQLMREIGDEMGR